MIKKILKTSINLGTSVTARYLYWVFSGNAVSIVLAFFTTIIIARYLTKEEFGLYLALFTFANLGADLGEVGLGSTLASFLPGLVLEKKHTEIHGLLSTAFYIEFTLGIIMTIVLIVFSPVLAHFLFANTQPLNITITALMMFALLLFNFATFALSAFKKFKEVATISIFYSVIRLLLLFGVAFLSRLTLSKTLIIFMFTPLVGWWYSLFHLGFNEFIGKGSLERAKKLVKFSGFLSLQKIFVGISSRLDFLMLVPLAGSFEAGVYGAASRISQIYPFTISSFAQVLAPKFAEYKTGKSATSFFKKTGLVTILLLLSDLVFYIFAKPIILFLFGAKYIDAIPVFQGLLLAMIGFIAATPFVSLLIYTLKKPYITAISSLVQLIFIFSSNLLFVPRFGRFGPVIGIGLGNAAIFLISAFSTWYYLKKET